MSKKSGSSTMVFVRLVDLDVTRIEFGKPKVNTTTGIKMVNLRYRDKDGVLKQLFVKYPKMKVPFGINTKTELIDEKAKKRGDIPAPTGYNIAQSLPSDYASDSSEYHAVFLKLQELDRFFMDKIMENRQEWIDIPESRNASGVKTQIEGDDAHGYNGLWKRVLKWSRNKNKNSAGIQEVLSEYPPRIESSFDVKFEDKTILDEDGKRKCKFNTQFFDESNVEVTGITQANCEDTLPKFAEVTSLVCWSRLTCSKTWVTLRSDIKQCIVIPYKQLSRAINYLDDDEDEDDDDEDLCLGGTNYLEMDDEPTKPKEKIVEEEDDDNIDGFMVEEEIPKKKTSIRKKPII